MFTKALANRPINLLNLHFGLFVCADGIVHIFLAVYFYQIGIPLSAIILALGGINLGRLFIRPFVLKLCAKIGIRKTLILGVLTFLPVYPLLSKVQSVDIWLVLFVITAAISYTFYWTTYHPYFSILGDREHRGKQVGMREIAQQSATILAPLLGGIILRLFGFGTNISVGLVIMMLAIFPLLWTPEVPLPPKLKISAALREIGKEGFWFFFADNFYLVAHDLVWRMSLFFLLKDYFSYGGLLSLAVLLQMCGALFTGYRFDLGEGKKLFPLGITIMSLVILGRIFFAFSVPIVIFLDFVFALGYALFQPVRDSVLYNLSQKSPSPLWFIAIAETGADLGAIVSYIALLIFLSFGGTFRFFMLLGILGLGISGIILQRYFGQSKGLSEK